ncbi:hypothetical protein F0U60_08900 [Archangium minus]|uniref:Uncharacterized protein n=1 Tax=Archangium minus TaxID=83450 RepID=A0ABY9WKS5_9BACT|nr:hypothetical protein F0U61_08900 [Archangium violaceum]WNG44210.1 hypothetical protein F0U60_08900 [Archangium minus]
MLSLVAVLLAVSPMPGQPSLLNSVQTELRASPRLLAVQDAPAEGGSRLDAPAPDDREARIRQLTREVEDINARLRQTSSNWPIGSVVMAYSGYVLAPLLLVGLPMLVIGLTSTVSYATTLVAVGAVLSVLGGGGVALLILGITSGLEASGKAKVEREELLRQRNALEDELRELKRVRPESSLQVWRDGRGESFIPVASLAF